MIYPIIIIVSLFASAALSIYALLVGVPPISTSLIVSSFVAFCFHFLMLLRKR